MADGDGGSGSGRPRKRTPPAKTAAKAGKSGKSGAKAGKAAKPEGTAGRKAVVGTKAAPEQPTGAPSQPGPLPAALVDQVLAGADAALEVLRESLAARHNAHRERIEADVAGLDEVLPALSRRGIADAGEVKRLRARGRSRADRADKALAARLGVVEDAHRDLADLATRLARLPP